MLLRAKVASLSIPNMQHWQNIMDHIHVKQ